MNAALFSKTDMVIGGDGSLTVEGNFSDGIASTDGLVIASGTITVTAVDDGVRGKDYLVIDDGTLNVTAGGDGLKSDNEEDTIGASSRSSPGCSRLMRPATPSPHRQPCRSRAARSI